MFEIDFLKKQGLPPKARPVAVAFSTAVLVLMILGLSILYVQVFYNHSLLKSKQSELKQLQSRVKKNTSQINLKSKIEKDLEVSNQCRSEIAGAVDRYVQWTPVLLELAESLPEKMLINELTVVRTVETKSTPSILNPKKKVDYEIIHRTLKSSIYDFTGETDGSIALYLQSLRQAGSLKNLFEKTYIVETGDAQYQKQEDDPTKVRNYVINCVLKSQKSMVEK